MTHLSRRALVGGVGLGILGSGLLPRQVSAESPAAPGSTYNIGGGSQVSLLECIGGIESVADRPVEIEFAAQQLGDVRDTGADTTRAATDLGFTAATELRQGLANQFDWVSRNEAALRNDRLSTVFRVADL